ncbi:MAG: flavodoxin domain-containing protein [Treponema sp.]|nr:flavodoxin domain-containing protein [Treponema sp.]
MKTIILYATKYGAAGEIAWRIAEKTGGAVTYNLKQNPVPSLVEYDCIIFGSSVYAGMIRGEAKTFLSKNADVMQEKKLGLFLCGIGESGEKTYFESNFSQEILQKAKVKSFLGGIFDPKKAGLIERLIIKLVTKKSSYINIIDDEKIEKFAEELKS